MVRQWQIVASNGNSSCKLFLPKKYQLKYDIRKSDIHKRIRLKYLNLLDFLPFVFQIFHFKNNDRQMHEHIIRTWPRYIAKGLLFAIKYKLLFTYLGQYCTQIALINQPFNSCKGLNLFELITSLQFLELFVFIADVQPLLQKVIYSRISQSSRKTYIFECNLRFNQRFFFVS